MVRFVSRVAMVAAVACCGPAWAASDITTAAIATGRLLVLGTTERPHTPVVLDGQFQTESDDKGRFQYDLVYHPARCVIAATIEGKAYEAVVGNCGQSCPTPMTGASLSAEPPQRPTTTGSARSTASASAILPDTGPAAPAAVGGAARPPAAAIVNPPQPPRRPAFRLGG